MKSLRSFLFSFGAAACWLLAGCSKSDQTPPTGLSTVTPDGQMQMQFRWLPQKEYIMRFELVSVADAVLQPNLPAGTKQRTRLDQQYTIAVLKELPGGGKALELEFTGTQMEITMGENVIFKFDAGQDPSLDAGNPLASMLRRTLGGRLKYVTDAKGRVVSVDGVPAFVGRVMQGAPADLQAGLGTMYNEGFFRQLVDVARTAPDEGVKPGDSWNQNVQEEMGPLGTLVMNSKLTFKTWEQHGTRKCARIESTGQLSTTPPRGTAAQPAVLTMQIENGTMTATGWFDPELGMVVESIADQTMTVKMTTMGKTVSNPTQQKVSFKLLDVVDRAP